MKVNCIAFAFNLAISAFVAMPAQEGALGPVKKGNQLQTAVKANHQI